MVQINCSLSGVILNSVHRSSKEGTLKFRANLSKEFSRKMEWGDLSVGQTSANMEGAIVDAARIMAAEQSGLFAAGEFRADVQKVSKFEILRMEVENKRGKGHRFVLDFEAKFVKSGIAALADEWILAVGSGAATMKINGMFAEAPTPKDPEK